MSRKNIPWISLLLPFLFPLFANAQTGITIGPPRVYYTIGPGQNQTERVLVSNPSKDYALELAVSFEDWEYSSYGDNILYPPNTRPTSCANWISIADSYFSLQPGESKYIDVNMAVPVTHSVNDSVPVRTVMMYVTQLNPREGTNHEGANIRIAVRTGIKLYQRYTAAHLPDINISNLKYEKVENNVALLALYFENTGKIWADGVISTELLNPNTGEKVVLEKTPYYSMPGDQRIQNLLLPEDLKAASYIATLVVTYGDQEAVKIAELDFTHVRH